MGAVGALGGITGAVLLASIGTPQPEHVAYAGRLLEQLPEWVRTAAHEPEGAVALLFALLVHDDAAALAAQRAAVEDHGGAALWSDVDALAAEVRELGARARLPLLDILLPALRELSPDQRASVRATAQRLIEADRTVDMFELALMHVLGRQLAAAGTEPGGAQQLRSLQPLRDEVELVLSAVAWSGAAEQDAAAAAFMAAAANVQPQTGELTLRARDEIDILHVDMALGRVRGALAGVRRRFLEACMLAVAHDGVVRVQEAELLRAVAEAVDCPMPPVG